MVKQSRKDGNKDMFRSTRKVEKLRSKLVASLSLKYVHLCSEVMRLVGMVGGDPRGELTLAI